MQQSSKGFNMQSTPASSGAFHNSFFQTAHQSSSVRHMSTSENFDIDSQFDASVRPISKTKASMPRSSSVRSLTTAAQDKFQTKTGEASPLSLPKLSTLTFDHFRPKDLTPSTDGTDTPTRCQSGDTQVPPVAFQDATALQAHEPYFNIRFLDGEHRGSGSARTDVHMSVPADTKFVKIKPRKRIHFEISTPETMSRKWSLDNDAESSDESVTGSKAGSKLAGRKKPRVEPTEQAAKDTPPKVTKRPELRTNKPLKNSEDVHMDVWRIILKNSPLKFLLRAQDISKAFRHLLQAESTVWYESRINQYSKKMPRPPGQMTEQQYAELLEGKGCQMKDCARKSTGKIYWAFRGRFCEHCFAQQTMKEEEVKRYRFEDPVLQDLLTLLPAAVIDGGKYSRCRLFNSQTEDWETTTAGPVYAAANLDDIEAEYKQLLVEGTSDEEMIAWKARKKEEAKTLTSHLADIENWEKSRASSAPRHRNNRMKFFQEQAALLSPPMSRDVLSKMLAFRMALDANSPPTLKSWEVLKAKIVKHQAKAEKLVSYDEQMRNLVPGAIPTPDIAEFIALRTARSPSRPDGSPHPLPEQSFVLNLGRKQLVHWKMLDVNDADLALQVLRGVFDAYEQEPYVLNVTTDGIPEYYKLTLDDARMIVQEVLEPETKEWANPLRTRVALSSFKCAGCPRKDCKTKYSFVKGFEHIHTAHAQFVGEDAEFAMFAKPYPRYSAHDNFPWYTVLWPRYLPLVASHHKVSRQDKWMPDADVPYVQAKESSTVSAFDGREALDNPSISASDFAGNLAFAASKFKSTLLDINAQTRIVLQYALDRHATVHGLDMPELADFTACLRQIKEANKKFDLKYRCGSCSRQTNVARTTKFIKSPVQFHELEEHFQRKHSDGDWTIDMMDLPDGPQLLDLIVDGDAELATNQALVLAREEIAKRSLRKRPCPKANVTLSTPKSMDIFDTLYIKK